jgi:hypothetical protein
MSGKWSVVPEVPCLHERSAGATNNFGTYHDASDFRERVFGRPADQTGFAERGATDRRYAEPASRPALKIRDRRTLSA